MAIKTRKLKGGDKYTRGVRVTEKNYVELTGWASKYAKNATAVVHVAANGDESDHKIQLHIPHLGIRVARVGDVLVLVEGEDLYVTKEADFKGFA